ncbi:TPA: GtrA family protein [Legionella bozemanae]|uniref:GtrA-like protein n=1 Tax=Legionella bozemanae TaxID=447 RepID=A0A0W0RJC0_LEGBO|nr:GtrA family protein [Legionella bozemanae]KTC71150.1 GtrA-like protein [Legionella bozemanae]STO33285.1 GtrA-like protein [Legionella bozemanae]
MFYYFKSKQFIAFLMAGVIAVIVNFCSRILYSYSFSFSTSIILAYVTGMVVSFILTKFFVFKASQQTFTRSIIFFILINLIGMSQTLLVSLLFAHYFLPAMDIKSLEIAHAIGLASPTFTTYLGHKFLTFREKI